MLHTASPSIRSKAAGAWLAAASAGADDTALRIEQVSKGAEINSILKIVVFGQQSKIDVFTSGVGFAAAWSW